MQYIKSEAIPNTYSRLKRNIIPLMLFAFLSLMLIFPQKALNGASNGLLLWYNTLLPSLLPFIIISGILIRLEIIPLISRLLYPILKPLFPISQNGAYPVFIGFLSGLPIGAKVSAELASYHKISSDEAIYIASMCNNASPSFILNFIAASSLNDPSKGILMLIIVYLSAVLASMITYRLFIHKHIRKHKKSAEKTLHEAENDTSYKSPPKSKVKILSAVDSSIMSAFDAAAKIGGYVILFSILTEFTSLFNLPSIYQAFLSGFLEITTGIRNISLLNINPDIKFILASAFTAFGGLSAASQTQSVISPAGLSIRFYIITKLIQGIIAAILSSFIIFIM